ncbi:cupin-like domain-containing protein [Allopontixanthobacter sp.]|uniref:cupin-like domain-containing protein n=1 Tax=Allopontixanthobacter sp. TaxID=2906452 RepID=UPI002ABC1175|nr:cupin-like domain-containing protein [Allopontixanthobacter sp.]MDZ4307840.1 cupin-like domain-containing protein [Allopontixanthobacter sp.]
MPTPVKEVDPGELGSLAARADERLEPAVTRGLAVEFPVVRAAVQGDQALLQYLSELVLPVEVQALHAPAVARGKFGYSDDLKSFNFSKRIIGFGDFVSELLEPPLPEEAIAVQGIRVREAAPRFTEENALICAPAGGEYRLWLGTRAEVAIHCDPVPNIAYVAGGNRRFTLFPPEEIGNLYLGPFDPVPNGTQISLADPLEPDHSRYPRFGGALARSLFADLEPGDAIFIPTGWYHHVQALSPINLLVNYWWQSDGARPSPWDALMHGFMALRGLSPADKRVWRAMFAHYIFEESGDSGSHIPPHSRGILSRPTPETVAAMRKSIVRSLTSLNP